MPVSPAQFASERAMPRPRSQRWPMAAALSSKAASLPTAQHPMTYDRSILGPVARRDDLRKDGSFDLRNIVEAYIRFGIIV
jgi:hypothetical protein